mmetsp:Transcript_10809/g.28601  ORF Transcript_10809/g.28601 Transcript_10809/m.28601 type:complete len:382 (-) Transcript_10809:72-1217(-)
MVLVAASGANWSAEDAVAHERRASAADEHRRLQVELQRKLQEWRERRESMKATEREPMSKDRPTMANLRRPGCYQALVAQGLEKENGLAKSATRCPAVLGGHGAEALPLSEICQNSWYPTSPSVLKRSTALNPDSTPQKACSRQSPLLDAPAERDQMPFLELWEERDQVPRAPPSSPVRRPAPEDDPTRPLQLSRHSPQDLAAALEAALRPLVVSAAAEAPACDTVGGAMAAAPPCERLSEEGVADSAFAAEPESIEAGAIVAGEAPDDVWDEPGDEEAALRRRLRAHVVEWGELNVIDNEDHLCRAFDISIFSFFEARDRARQRVLDMPEPVALESIPEYPPGWPRWRIDSFELREAARAARQQPRCRQLGSFSVMLSRE